MSSPFTVTGKAAAFEGNVQWELKQGATVVRRGFTTAEGVLHAVALLVHGQGAARHLHAGRARRGRVRRRGHSAGARHHAGAGAVAHSLHGVLSLRDLNRTLLLRQHLLSRTSMPALAMVEHLIGLQAQENLPPYLSLAARLDDFDPLELSGAIERRDAVRFLTMRGTIHVLTPDDALSLRGVGAGRARPAEREQPEQPPRPGRARRGPRRVPRDGCWPTARCRSRSSGERLAARVPRACRRRRWRTPRGSGRRWSRCRRAGCGDGRVASSTRPWRPGSGARPSRSTCASSCAATSVRSARRPRPT